MTTTAAPAAPVPMIPALQRLRVTFPDWAFLYNPFAHRWHAVRAHHPTITTYSAEELGHQVGAYQGLPAYPTDAFDRRVTACPR